MSRDNFYKKFSCQEEDRAVGGDECGFVFNLRNKKPVQRKR